MITIIIGEAATGKSLLARGMECLLDDHFGETVEIMHEGGTSKQIKAAASKADHVAVCMQSEPSNEVLALAHRIIRIERGPAETEESK